MDHETSFVLASRSPRRLALLRGLGIEPRVIPAEIPERAHPGEPPDTYALRLARLKARQVAERLEDRMADSLVLGADTVVAVSGIPLGKPRDDTEARHMLGLLSARQHHVHTGLALVAPRRGREAAGISTSAVRFACLTRQEIDWYVATGEGRDKAGAYAVQGLAALFIEGVDGSPSNVVGLPLELLYRKAAELGCDLKRLADGSDGRG